MDRDFDKEKILDKMRELRDRRDLELLNQDMENVNLNSDYQKEVSKNKVLNVKYLGTIEIDGEQKGLYLLIEQKEEKDGRLAEIEKYYTGDGEFLAADSNLDQFEFITLKEEYINKEGLLEQIENMDKEGILDLAEIENERLEELARELGIDVKDLRKVAEIDTEEQIDKENEEEQNEKDDNEERDINKDEKEVLTKKQIEKISTKTEIKTNQKVTDKDTMASLLNVQGKGYTKIAVVYSEKLRENGNTTKFSFVGIKSDGSAEKIDTLKQAYGNNPTKNVQALNRDGSKIEEDKVNSIFRVKGKDEEQLAVNIGQMGNIEPKFVRTPRQDGEKAISIPIETQNIRPTTREIREFMNRSRNTSIDDNIKKIEEHKEEGCEEATVLDIDDNDNNNTHNHISIDKCVDEIMEEYEDVANYYNHSDLVEKAKNYLEENKNIEMNEKDFKENMKAKLAQDIESEHEPRGPENRQ